MKVGDRVRINCPEKPNHGMEATIWQIDESGQRWATHHPQYLGMPVYFVDIDGIGKVHLYKSAVYGYLRQQLIPLTKPREALVTWEETFKGTNFNIRREHETI